MNELTLESTRRVGDIFDWAPDLVIKWLESPEGEKWSRKHHAGSTCQHLLVSVKDDMPDPFAIDKFVAVLWHV